MKERIEKICEEHFYDYKIEEEEDCFIVVLNNSLSFNINERTRVKIWKFVKRDRTIAKKLLTSFLVRFTYMPYRSIYKITETYVNNKYKEDKNAS